MRLTGLKQEPVFKQCFWKGESESVQIRSGLYIQIPRGKNYWKICLQFWGWDCLQV